MSGSALSKNMRIWSGSWEGTDAKSAVVEAWNTVVAKDGNVAMMVCTSIRGTIYCASSNQGGYTGGAYSADFHSNTKKLLDACSQKHGGKTHNQAGTCAEVFVLNSLLKDAIDKDPNYQRDIVKGLDESVVKDLLKTWAEYIPPGTEMWAYGTRMVAKKGKPLSKPDFHEACSSRISRGRETFGCRELLEIMSLVDGKSSEAAGSSSRQGSPSRTTSSRPSSPNSKNRSPRRRDYIDDAYVMLSGRSKLVGEQGSFYIRDEDQYLKNLFARDVEDYLATLVARYEEQLDALYSKFERQSQGLAARNNWDDLNIRGIDDEQGFQARQAWDEFGWFGVRSEPVGFVV
jgi:hypothetical protein